MNIMLLALPILMVVFTISYSAAFAIYIIMNSLVSTLIAYLMFLIQKNKKQKTDKQKEITNVEYSRY